MIAGLVVFVGIILAAFLPWPVLSPSLRNMATDMLRSELGARAGESTVFRVSRFSLLPRPQIHLISIAYKDATGDIQIEAPRATATIHPLALLAGRVEISDVVLQSAKISIRQEAGSVAAGRLASLLNTLAAQTGMPGMKLVNGHIQHLDKIGSILPRSSFEAVNLKIQPGRGVSDAQIAGAANWQGQGMTVAVRWPRPSTGSSKPADRLEMMVRAPLFYGRFSGHITTLDGLTGTMEFDTPQLGQALSLLGETGPVHAVAQQMRIQATSTATLATDGALDIHLRDVDAVLDGQKFEGALAMRPNGGRSAISGTLAGKSFDFGRVSARLFPGSSFADIANLPIEPSQVAGSRDIDIRLSTDQLRIGPALFEKAAMQFLISPTRIDLNLLQAQGYKGQVKARFSAAIGSAEPDIRATIGLEKIDLGLINQDMLGTRRITGSASGQLILEGIGKSVPSILSSAAGRANITIRQGDINGFSLAEIIRRTERQPLVMLRDWRTGRSSFETAQFTGIMSHGVMELTEGSILAPAYRLNVLGKIGIGEQDIALGGTLSAPGPGGTTIPFSIIGPWAAPAINSDVLPIMHRSKAASTVPIQ
jgi:AsmA protein